MNIIILTGFDVSFLVDTTRTCPII